MNKAVASLPESQLLVVVDETDRPIGTVEKMDCHSRGLLHRAVSGFVFAPDGRLLLQRRSPSKYHSGDLVANSCCSHPYPGETSLACIARRTREELGIDVDYRPFGSCRYLADVGNGLIEHELVHLSWGVSAQMPAPNAAEVSEILWCEETGPVAAEAWVSSWAPWFRIYVERGIVAAAFAAHRRL